MKTDNNSQNCLSFLKSVSFSLQYFRIKKKEFTNLQLIFCVFLCGHFNGHQQIFNLEYREYDA